ncbi:hypothetical protein D3C72_1531400 [compost metagenome]
MLPLNNNRLLNSRTISPAGILIKNIQCQESHSVITPPRKTPADPPAAAAAPQNPKARLSSFGSVNLDMTRVRAAGAIRAEPSPCSPRPIFNTSSDQAIPAKNDAAVRIPNPHIKILRAPKRSDKRPPSSRKPPNRIT